MQDIAMSSNTAMAQSTKDIIGPLYSQRFNALNQTIYQKQKEQLNQHSSKALVALEGKAHKKSHLALLHTARSTKYTQGSQVNLP
jgi:hypothetical protein